MMAWYRSVRPHLVQYYSEFQGHVFRFHSPLLHGVGSSVYMGHVLLTTLVYKANHKKVYSARFCTCMCLYHRSDVP